MNFIIESILLVIVLLIYFKIADQYNIIDKPNQRSSHSIITIRGGGIVFLFAILIWFIQTQFEMLLFAIGAILIGVISFVDDRYTISTKPRLIVHLISVGLLLYQLHFDDFAWYYWIIGFILVIGWINAFNFMDGINGITAFYTLSVLVPVYFLNQDWKFTDTDLLLTVGLSVLIFSFFNARKRAKTFAGDVGSVTMAYILAFVIVSLILFTGDWYYILFVAVYGIDAVLTIARRLYLKENIFEAHRSHLYQFLANEKKVSHLKVSGGYAIIQVAISFGLILCPEELKSFYSLSVLILLSIVYLYWKSSILKSIQLA